MDGSASSLDIPPTGQRDAAAGAPVYATVNKTPREASELNRDEETSSNWDESEGDQLPSQGNGKQASMVCRSVRWLCVRPAQLIGAGKEVGC